MKSYTSTLKRILSYIGHYWIVILGSLCLAAITVVLTLYVPILIGEGVDQMIGGGQVNFSNLIFILKKIVIVIVITSICQWVMNHMNHMVTYRVVKDIRIRAFDKIGKLPVSYLDSHSHGDVLSRIITDIDQFSEGLLMGFTQLFTGIMTIVGTLIVMFFLQPAIATFVVLVTPLSLFVAAYIAKKTYAMFRLQSDTKGEMVSFVEEMIGNQKVVKAFLYEEHANEQFEQINERFGECSLNATFFSSLTNPSTRFVNGVVYTGVGVFGAVLGIQGKLSVGQLTSFLSYANQYTKPFNEISGVVTELQNALACATRVFELIDEEIEQPDDEKQVLIEPVDGSVCLKNVCFSYEPKRPLIENFNLFVEAGKRVAIVGPTGCGKSTLINLLMRFCEVDFGSIFVDENDIYEITRKSLRKNYGMVLQETWLYTGSVRDNIAFGNPQASLEEVVEAAKKAHAHSFIKRLPNGYDTWILEGGSNLSQGERQLLCIARAMLLNPPMLILDEATSSIDTRTEVKVQKAFTTMMKGKTSFIVAHRLSTIKEADVILVMKEGKVIEQGTHTELLEINGFYTQLYESQFEQS